MTRSHKPIVWGPFAAGGTFSALVIPVLILITGIAVPLGILPANTLAYDRIFTFADTWWPGKLLLLACVILPVWHAAHRARITAHDFGVRSDFLIANLVYIAAAIATMAAILAVLSI